MLWKREKNRASVTRQHKKSCTVVCEKNTSYQLSYQQITYQPVTYQLPAGWLVAGSDPIDRPPVRMRCFSRIFLSRAMVRDFLCCRVTPGRFFLRFRSPRRCADKKFVLPAKLPGTSWHHEWSFIITGIICPCSRGKWALRPPNFPDSNRLSSGLLHSLLKNMNKKVAPK